MPIQIEIQDDHAQLLVNFYVGRLKVLRGEILEREKESKDITLIIQKLKRKEPALVAANHNQQAKVNYNEKWPWIKKVQFALENNDRPLTTKEIVDFLTDFEPSFLFDRKKAVASVSSILSSKSGENKEFSRVETESGDFAYELGGQDEQEERSEPVKHDLFDDDMPF